jgi:peroxiredoxin
MATKVSVITNPGNRISINNQLTSRISQLTDIDVSTKANNDVLVYDENTDKFVSKVIPVVDGGNF